MTKTIFLQILAAELGSDFIVTSRPDLPDSLLGPDFVCGGRGRLLAGFFGASLRNAAVNNILVRLAATRLHLPSHTICVLIIGGLHPSELTRIFERDFDGFVEMDYPRRTLRMFELMRSAPQMETIRRIKDGVFRVGSFLYRASVSLGLTHPEGRPLLDVLRSRSDFVTARVPFWRGLHSLNQRDSEARTEDIRMVRLGDALISEVTGKTDAGMLRILANHCKVLVRDRYRMDDGIPYLGRISPAIMLVDRVPHVRDDPLKAVRALSFSGWLVARATTVGDVIGHIRWLSRKLPQLHG